MYICSCHAVTDGAMRALIRSGQVKTFAQMAKTTGLATQCGICGRIAKELFYKIRNEEIAAGNISALAEPPRSAPDALAAPEQTETVSPAAAVDDAHQSCGQTCRHCVCSACPAASGASKK